MVHCDIKPANFVFVRDSMDSPIKLIDFGFCQVYHWNKKLNEICGTPHYMAPEVIKGKYSCAADIWSMGATLFFMNFHFNPFYTQKVPMTQILKTVRRGFTPQVKAGWGARIPTEPLIKDLIAKMLRMNVGERLTAEEVLDHP